MKRGKEHISTLAGSVGTKLHTSKAARKKEFRGRKKKMTAAIAKLKKKRDSQMKLAGFHKTSKNWSFTWHNYLLKDFVNTGIRACLKKEGESLDFL